MTAQFEVREFRKSTAFKGDEVARLIKENHLEDFDLQYYATEHNNLSVGLTNLSPYMHVVKFRRAL